MVLLFSCSFVLDVGIQNFFFFFLYVCIRSYENKILSVRFRLVPKVLERRRFFTRVDVMKFKGRTNIFYVHFDYDKNVNQGIKGL